MKQLWKTKRLEENELKPTEVGRAHILRRLLLEPDGLREPEPFKTVVGPIASGAPVVQDQTIFDRLADTQAMRKVIGLEMESSAILMLAYLTKLPYAIVMKGVMDHADIFKSDNMKPFAAKASAECLIDFLRQNLPPNIPEQINNLGAADREVENPQEDLASRLRRATAHVYARFDLASLGIGGPRRPVTLDQVFVPLQFQSWYRIGGVDFGDEPLDGDDVGVIMDGRGLKDLGWLEEMLDDGSRFVVLGDPGSGKSTLCKYVAVSYARREEEWVPLLLTVRDWIAEGAREGLLDMAAREATQRLSVRTTAEALERLCRSGKVLLIIDGIDEAAELPTRRALRDRVHGFAVTYPYVPMLVTSRFAGYREIPLDEDVLEELEVAPFDDDALELFVRRWYEVVEPHDPAERLRKCTSLLQALEREPRAKALAHTPLLAALVAGVHSSHGDLPGSRALLYEKVVEQLLDVRPRERGQGFADLSWTEQLPILENLALRLQEQREARDDRFGFEILSRPDQLVEVLAELLREQQPESGTHAIRDISRRWTRWLVEESSLLQEQRPGMIGFVHLSLMEYLAGQALLHDRGRAGDEPIVEIVVERHNKPIWSETILLMLGSRGNDPQLGNRIIDRLITRSSTIWWYTAAFLLGLLREGIDSSPSQRTRALDAVCTCLSGMDSRVWPEGSSLLEDIVRLGGKHGREAERWIHEKLCRGSIDELHGTLALLLNSEEWITDETLEAEFRTRHDIDRVTPILLDFAPSHRFGTIGRKLASPDAHLHWALVTPAQHIVWRSLPAPDAISTSIWVPSLLNRATWIGDSISKRTAILRAQQEDASLPLQIRWSTLQASRLSTIAPSFVRAASAKADSRATRSLEHVISISAHHAARRFLLDLASSLLAVPAPHSNLAAYLALTVTARIPEDVRHDPRRFARQFLSMLREHTVHWYGQHLDLEYAARFAMYFEQNFADVISTQPVDEMDTSTSTLWSDLVNAGTEEDRYRAAADLLLALIADTHAGFQTTTRHDTNLTVSILPQLRLENRWLNLFFTPLVEHATLSRPLPEHPDLHALLLTFGLVQYQTTWQWPDSPHWRSWFSASPPEHWLPAHVWHLVRSVQEPDDPTLGQHAAACLERADWPELASALREHTVPPTPPDLLALFEDPAHANS